MGGVGRLVLNVGKGGLGPEQWGGGGSSGPNGQVLSLDGPGPEWVGGGGWPVLERGGGSLPGPEWGGEMA